MKVKPITVTRTFRYSPKDYLDWCYEQGEEPTQEGFIEFITEAIYDDMRSPMELDLADYIEVEE